LAEGGEPSAEPPILKMALIGSSLAFSASPCGRFYKWVRDEHFILMRASSGSVSGSSA